MRLPARARAVGGATDAVPLSARGLRLDRAGRTVLRDVDLDCRAGEWLAVVGPNGAGKSTLLRCLAGLERPAGGTVELDGRPIAGWSARARGRRLAWLAQAEPVDPLLAPGVAELVGLGRLPHRGLLGTESVEDRAAVRQALADTGGEALACRALDALSGGERQRVLLARALAARAPVLLLDEPTTHLDAPHQRLLARVLRREAARGVAVASVVHDLNLALAADRVAVIARGGLVACGPADSAAVHAAIGTVFNGAVTVRVVDGRPVALPVW